MFDQWLKGSLIVIFMFFLTGCGHQEKNYTQLGLDALNNHDLQKAFDCFEKAINQDPSNVANYLIVGQIYLRLKLYQRAVYIYAAATRVAPNNGSAYSFLALSYRYMGDTENAIKAIKKSMAVYYQQGNMEGVKQDVMALNSLNPGAVR